MLGTYTIPNGDETKKDNYQGIAGTETFGKAKGLRKEFLDECKAAIDELKKSGAIIHNGNYGYMNKADASDMAYRGNRSYLNNISYYQFGLALDIQIVSDKCEVDNSGTKLKGGSAVRHILDGFGLKMVVAYGRSEGIGGGVFTTSGSEDESSGGVFSVGSSTAHVFLVPKNINKDSSATDVSYDATETSEQTNTAGTSSTSGASVASVAYFFSNQYASYAAEAESELLTGNRALANDTTVMSYVKSAAESSLRTFSSGPNGEFLAWYPDYWGMYGNKTPYLELDSIELQDLKIEQNEASFYSHVYCKGVTAGGSPMGNAYTQGVVSIESDTVALASAASATEDAYVVSDQVSDILKNLIYIPEGEEWRYTPKELYRRYGARPYSSPKAKTLIETSDSITFETNPQYILPFLKALSEFMKLWAGQNKVTLSITFMPELFPGCRIKLKDFDVSFYVESVSHKMDYQSGFTTTVSATCPIGTLVRGMVNPNASYKADDSRGNSAVAARATGGTRTPHSGGGRVTQMTR